ncbi:hypothetical protein G5C60_08215 [Streptomyces sp. HC44]|uniref:Uncharacterized protein n=1 Tax=Streptomyces scabichelini TaxID=2711217 RepID=A0A6G4V168_9ACTN|nr:hypothetical protein [Streptomyces scabichelini]NGO07637.1 hypothetical protein [Streptomyces scabichelini]
MPVETLIQDDLFGELSVWSDPEKGEVAVGGRAVPDVVLRRVAGTRTNRTKEHIPIGTRKRGRLTLDVDGQEAVIRPAKGRVTRRSYRIDVRHAGRAYRLLPDSIAGSRLLKDKEHIGDFSSDGDGRVLAEWKEGARVEAADAALGYALAAAFGTGAQPMWTLALDAIGDLIP